MRNYLREAIREEVRQGVREEARHDGAAAAAGNQPSGDQGGGDRAGRPVQREAEAEAQFRVVLRPLASSLPLGFFAFTVGTVLLTAIQLNWSPPATTAQIAVLVLAFVVPLEESYQRTVLPLGRRGRARSSLEGSFAHQVQQAEQEPGVRRQLCGIVPDSRLLLGPLLIGPLTVFAPCAVEVGVQVGKTRRHPHPGDQLPSAAAPGEVPGEVPGPAQHQPADQDGGAYDQFQHGGTHCNSPSTRCDW